MSVFAGLDVSSKHISVCVGVDKEGAVLFESEVLTDPKVIEEVLRPYRRRLRHIGIEACSTGIWLQYLRADRTFGGGTAE